MKRGEWQETDEKLFSVSLFLILKAIFTHFNLNQKISIRTLTFFSTSKQTEWISTGLFVNKLFSSVVERLYRHISALSCFLKTSLSCG